MTDNSPDLAQLIFEAGMQPPAENPDSDSWGPQIELGGTVIGTIPLHLRNLYNLLIRFSNELDEEDSFYDYERWQYEIIYEIFIHSLARHMPNLEETNYSAITFRGWEIIGYTEESSLKELSIMPPSNSYH